MGDFNAKVVGQTNTSERATGCFGLGQRNKRGDTLVEWATSKNFKIMNTQFQKKAGRRWTWRSPDENTKNEIDYIMTDKPSMVTDVTVINRINIGSDHRMVMGSIIVYFAKGEPRNVEYCKVFCGNAIYGCSGLGNCRMLNSLSIAYFVNDLISMIIR